MGVIKDFDKLREIVLSAKKAAFSESVILPQKTVVDLLENIIRNFPDEFESAAKIVKERDSILDVANKQAKAVREASDPVLQAEKKAKEVLDNAQEKANQMKAQATEFIAKILDQTLVEVNKTISILEESKEGLKDANI
ncbi:MAG TPA: hypothetical protein PKV16_01795 [Caldisericia bacterium]|nr:hypothetical protein [Caldisericia bacterium]HPF48864.1 hypothetical protein [Caldisericia bacterium]HPI83272.1 hypothetical protein [Caldisericia bacterium]HPQ92499.1 hypothetical protein [Caldisericia bacterium]HRV74403.1 hypothetical protein [Caldisericia bacterium]